MVPAWVDIRRSAGVAYQVIEVALSGSGCHDLEQEGHHDSDEVCWLRSGGVAEQLHHAVVVLAQGDDLAVLPHLQCIGTRQEAGVDELDRPRRPALADLVCGQPDLVVRPFDRARLHGVDHELKDVAMLQLASVGDPSHPQNEVRVGATFAQDGDDLRGVAVDRGGKAACTALANLRIFVVEPSRDRSDTSTLASSTRSASSSSSMTIHKDCLALASRATRVRTSLNRVPLRRRIAAARLCSQDASKSGSPDTPVGQFRPGRVGR